MLQKLVNNNCTNWDIQLYTMLFSYRTTYKVATGHFPFELVYGLLPLMPTEYNVPTQRTTTDLDFTKHRVLAARTADLDKLDETRLKAQTHQGQIQWNRVQWVQTQEKPHQFRMGDHVLWYPKGANVHARKLQNKWFGPYRVQYLLSNNTVFLVTVDKFDLDPVIVNINKLKTYRCLEEGLPDLSSSEQQTKTQLVEASFQNKDEQTRDVGTHPVILAAAIQPVPNPNTALHLDTSSLQPPIPTRHIRSHKGGICHQLAYHYRFKWQELALESPINSSPEPSRHLRLPPSSLPSPSFSSPICSPLPHNCLHRE